jgi:hypothetical protein
MINIRKKVFPQIEKNFFKLPDTRYHKPKTNSNTDYQSTVAQ